MCLERKDEVFVAIFSQLPVLIVNCVVSFDVSPAQKTLLVTVVVAVIGCILGPTVC
jgi:hypothetical protein